MQGGSLTKPFIMTGRACTKASQGGSHVVVLGEKLDASPRTFSYKRSKSQISVCPRKRFLDFKLHHLFLLAGQAASGSGLPYFYDRVGIFFIAIFDLRDVRVAIAQRQNKGTKDHLWVADTLGMGRSKTTKILKAQK
jgi:hypothetical protein